MQPKKLSKMPTESTIDQSSLEAKMKNVKSNLTCAEALSSYLIYLSQRVNESFYVKALKFVLMYHECFTLVRPKLMKKQQQASDIL